MISYTAYGMRIVKHVHVNLDLQNFGSSILVCYFTNVR